MSEPTRSRRFPVLVGLCALLAVGLFALLAQGSTSYSASAASGGGPEMGLNVISGGVCDAPQPTTCDVPFEGDFTLTIDLQVAPAAGYTLMQTYLDIGSDLDESTVGNKLVWPDGRGGNACICLPLPVGHFYHFDKTGDIFDPPLPISNYVGPLVQLSMTCSSTLTQTAVHLLPYGDAQAGTSGTSLTDSSFAIVIPKLNPLTINCVGTPTPTATETLAPTSTPTVTPTPTPRGPDDDGDGCTNDQELGSDPHRGGLRDPANPWDFYDIAGANDGPPDRIIDLANDIFTVGQHYAPTGTEPGYDVQFDRGPSAGPNVWNMTAPDGVIDLSNDILGVIQQYFHSCQ